MLNCNPSPSTDPLAAALEEALHQPPTRATEGGHRDPRDPLEACLRGELPSGRLPLLRSELGGNVSDRRCASEDLHTVQRYLIETKHDRCGSGKALSSLVGPIRMTLLAGEPVAPGTLDRLLAAARVLSASLDAREALDTIVCMAKACPGAHHITISARRDRIESALRDMDRAMGGGGLHSDGESSLAGAVTAFSERAEQRSDRLRDLMSVGSALHAVVRDMSARERMSDKVWEALKVYERTIEDCRRRAGDTPRGAALADAVRRCDGMRPASFAEHLVLADVQALLRRASDPDVAAQCDMVPLDEPDSSSDNEEVPDPRRSVPGVAGLYERGLPR